MDEDGSGAVGVTAVAVTAVAGLALLVGLSLPLFTVHYTPPGGAGVIDGQRVNAFSETVTGWRYAVTARWTALLYLLGLLILPVLTLGLHRLGLGAARLVTKPAMALFGILAAAGWVVLLGLGLLPSNLVMPTGGERQILPALHLDPLSAGYQRATQALGLNNTPTPHLAASFGAGWYVLAAAILVGLIALWRWAAYVAVILVAVMVILWFADRSAFGSVSAYLLAAGND